MATMSTDKAIAALRGDDPEARRKSIEELVRAADESVVRALLRHLHDTSWTFRDRLVSVLVEIGPDAVPPLRSAAADGLWYVRAAAAEALARIEDADASGVLIGLLGDRALGVRQAAGEGLARILNEDRLEVLAERVAPLGRDNLAPFLRVLRQEREPLYARLISLRPELGPGSGP